MAGFISGLMGAAGQALEKREQREYTEKKDERDRKRSLLELAAKQAMQEGLYNELPNIFGSMDELGKPEGAPKGVKEPYKQIGGNLAKLLGMRKQQQQQQGQQQQARSDVQGAPGVIGTPPFATGPSIATPPFLPPGQATPQPQQGQPAPSQQPQAPAAPVSRETPPLPTSRIEAITPEESMRRQRPWQERLGEEIEKGKAARGEREFETGRRHTGIQVEDATKQQMKAFDDFYKFFKSPSGGSLDDKTARDEANLAAFGRIPQQAGQKFAPFYINGSQVPEEVQLDGLGHPIDREKGLYKLEETTKQFYPAAAGPKSSGVDELTKWAKIIQARNPKLTPDQAVKQAANELFQGKFINPQERIELMKNATRAIVGEQGILEMPTHVPGAMQRGPSAIPFPGVRTPPLPAPSQPTQRAMPAAAQPATAAPIERWRPEIKGAERPRKTNSEIIMEQSGEAINTIQSLQQAHPDWFGPGGPAWQEITRMFGKSDPAIGTLKGSIEGLAGFLPSLHSFRSGAILDSWKKTLDNPLRNPETTMNVIREISKVAQKIRDSILNRNVGEMTAEGEEQKARGTSRGAQADPIGIR